MVEPPRLARRRKGYRRNEMGNGVQKCGADGGDVLVGDENTFWAIGKMPDIGEV